MEWGYGYSLIFLAVICVAIGEAFILKLYRDGGKELEKYDKKHSSILAANTNDFITKVSTMPELKCVNADFVGNRIEFLYKGNYCTIAVEDGVAFIEYDTRGIELRLSALGRTVNTFKFAKVAQAAATNNIVMDYAARRNIDEQQKQFEKITQNIRNIKLSWIVVVALTIIGFWGVIQQMSDAAIAKAKKCEYAEGVTYEELIDGYIPDAEWDTFNSDNHTAVVEVKGIGISGEEICIQFTGDPGRGFGDIDRQKFSLDYFEADGMTLDPVAAMDVIYRELFGEFIDESPLKRKEEPSESELQEEDLSKSELQVEADMLPPEQSDATQNSQVSTSLYYDVYAPIVSDVYATYGEYCEYALYDFDNDGISELITSFGTCDADWVNDVYTISNGYVNMLGQFYGPVMLYAEENGNGIYSVYGNMGYHTVEWITKEGDALYSSIVLDGEASGDNYYSNPYPIQYYSIMNNEGLMQ